MKWVSFIPIHALKSSEYPSKVVLIKKKCIITNMTCNMKQKYILKQYHWHVGKQYPMFSRGSYFLFFQRYIQKILQENTHIVLSFHVFVYSSHYIIIIIVIIQFFSFKLPNQFLRYLDFSLSLVNFIFVFFKCWDFLIWTTHKTKINNQETKQICWLIKI